MQKRCFGINQRLKGKRGRFRGNLSGKRVNFTGRTVISPDPNLRIDEVGVPAHKARVLTLPVRVTSGNLEAVRQWVARGGAGGGPYVHAVVDTSGCTKILLSALHRAECANALRPGYQVERQLVSGDVVLFNRQPSLHRLSIQAFRVRTALHIICLAYAE